MAHFLAVVLPLAFWAGTPACAVPLASHPSAHPLKSFSVSYFDLLYEQFADLVLPYGYRLEQHFVTTSDGYVLRLFRIPGHASRPRMSDEGDGVRPVVFLQHGLLDSAAAWVLNGPKEGLAFALADEGYDVWLGNARGNTYSRNHTVRPVASAQFWAYSWDEVGTLDVPAMFQYLKTATGVSSISYVGHSQGTTVILACLSAVPTWQSFIDVAVLLAPVAVAQHVTSPVLLTMATLPTDQLFLLLGWHEFLPSQELVSWLEGHLCEVEAALCVNVLAAICGYNPANLNTDRLPQYLKYTPAGTSVQNMVHWAQAVRTTRFPAMCYFDYGQECEDKQGLPRRCNQLVYGQLDPPVYELAAVHTKIALFTGGHDRITAPLDVELLREALPPHSLVYEKLLPDYEHLDFTWGSDAATQVYPDVIQLVKLYRGSAGQGAGTASTSSATSAAGGSPAASVNPTTAGLISAAVVEATMEV